MVKTLNKWHCVHAEVIHTNIYMSMYINCTLNTLHTAWELQKLVVQYLGLPAVSVHTWNWYTELFLLTTCRMNCMYMYTCMLCAKLGFGPSEDFTARSMDRCFVQQSEDSTYNPQIKLRHNCPYVKGAHIDIMYGYSSWTTHTDAKVVLDRKYNGGCQIDWPRDAWLYVQRAYVMDTRILLESELAAQAGWLATCYTYTWLPKQGD